MSRVFALGWAILGSGGSTVVHQLEISQLARQFFMGEIGRFGPCNGLRPQLGAVVADSGFLISSIPLDTLAAVAATGDPDAFNGSLRYFGMSNAMIRVCAAREDAFLCDFVGSVEKRRVFTCRAYHSCAAGLATRTGRDERITLLPIQSNITGSSYEGWSEIVTPIETSLESIQMTLAYGTAPYPPSLAVLTAVDETEMVRAAGEVVVGGDAWVASRMLGFRSIVLEGFDNESLLFWVPETDVGKATARQALDHGLAVLLSARSNELKSA